MIILYLFYNIGVVQSSLFSTVKGCDYVMHTASPFPLADTSDHDVIIKPAVEGTLSVLRACADSSTVKKVVLTSSCVAIMDNNAGILLILLSLIYRDDCVICNLNYLLFYIQLLYILGNANKVFTEEDWPDVDKLTSGYAKSKPLAEKAAWDFVGGLTGTRMFPSAPSSLFNVSGWELSFSTVC